MIYILILKPKKKKIEKNSLNLSNPNFKKRMWGEKYKNTVEKNKRPN